MTKLTFDDEFNTLSLYNGSSGTWQPAYSWAPNGLKAGSSWLVNPTWGPTSAADADIYSVNNGTLSIGIKPTPSDVAGAVGNTPYLAGQIETKPTFSQLYGYFEINAVLPSGGSGITSAFWLLPESGAWPPELDVFEQDTSQGLNAVETGVFTNQSGSNQQIFNWDYNLPNLSAGPHTYAVDWEADNITWYIDGKQVYQTATPADMHQPMYMLVDDQTSAAGSWNGSPAPGTTTAMQVNWVHAYDSNPYVNGVNTALGGAATDTGGTTAAASDPGANTAGDTTASAAAAANAATAAPTLAPTPTPASAGFHVAAGQIIGPNGQPFKAQGIDILESTLGSVVGDASGGALLKNFPATNMVRIAMESGYNSYNDPAFVNAVNWLTAKGIVVEIGNYNTTGGVATGQGLTDEVNWFAALASKYQSNPYVWFSTDNEPTDGNAFNGATTAAQLAAYNAIRDTGNTSMIGIEDTFAALNPANYAGMTNIHWDSHYYNWNAGGSTDVATNEAALTSRDNLLNSLFKSADGTIPIINGEFGNSTDGANIDAGASAAAQAVVDVSPQYSGFDSWVYYWPGNMNAGEPGDELTNENTGQLTPYGQQIAGAMTAANAPSGSGGTVPPPVSAPPVAPPVTPPVAPPVTAPVTPPVAPPVTPPVAPPVTAPVTPPVAPPVTPPVAPPVTLPVAPPVTPPVAPPVTPPVAPPVTLPVAPPASALPVTTGSGSDTLVLDMSEDAYKGDAKFTVSIDGKRLGGTFTTTASHGSQASQSFTFKGDFGSGPHTVAVKFLNDAWGGTAATDRNLYVDGISYNGTATGQTAALMFRGPVSLPIPDVATPSLDAETFVLSSGNAATLTLGTAASRLNFIGAGSVTLVGGSGPATVKAAAGSNTFVAGTGTLDVTGGSGKDAYVFHANSGLLKIEDFSIAKGDTLTVDKALMGSMQQTSDGQGGTLLTFGAGATHGIDIHGLAAMPAAKILWA